MKKLNFLIIVAFAFCSMQANAQRKLPADRLIIDTTGILPPEPPDYYSGKTTISGIGFTFKNLDEDEDFVRIGNVNNVKFEADPYLYPPPINGEEQIISNLPLFARVNDINQVKNAVRDALGMTIINQFKTTNNSAAIEISFIVNMNGTVAEIEFGFDKTPLMLSISPYKFYYIETLLKQRVIFTVRQAPFLKFIPSVHIRGNIKDL